MATKRSTNSNKPSLKSQGAGYSTTNRKGETTFYKSSKDASGYSDTRDGKNVGSSPGNPISRFDASGKQISVSPMPADSFTSTGKPNLPSKTQTSAPDIGLGAVAPGLGAMLKDGLYESTGTPGDGSTESLAQQTNQNQLEALRSMVSDTLGIKPPSLEKDYLKAEKKAGINDLQNSVNTYTSQLNNIIATRDQNLLRVEGQGRGIPEVIIGGQQAQIKKEAAMEALPVQAALDAAQGNLQIAQNRLDKLFAIHREDVQNDYNFKKGIVDSLYNFATQSEQRRFEAALADQKIKRDEKMENLKQIQEWSRLAVQTGQSSLISEFSALNPNSPTFQQDFGRLQARVRKPVEGTSTSYEIKTVNGKEVLFNPKTGEIKQITAPGGLASQQEYEGKKAAIEDDINRASELLSNSLGIKSSAGTYQPGFFGSLFTGAGGVKPEDGLIRNLTKFVPVIGNFSSASYASSQKDDFLSGVSYIVNNQTFDKLTSLKEGGVTFGSLTESERIAVGRAATDLASSVVVDGSGNITGFRGSEQKLVENLTKVLEGYKAAQDQLNIEYGIAPDERDEALLLWNIP